MHKRYRPRSKVHQAKAKMLDALHHQSGRCYWCCDYLADDYIEIDHILAKIHGGTDDNANLRVTCGRCNSLKATTLPMDFALYQAGGDLYRRTHGNNVYHVAIRRRHYRLVQQGPLYKYKIL